MTIGMKANFKVGNSLTDFTAKIVHIAESSEEGSRMVPITAEIEDTGDEALRPGSFAEITVPVAVAILHPVVTQTAIRPSEKGFLAYVIENGLAVERIVQLGLRTSEGLVEVISGLKAGEMPVTRGGEALRNGYPVRIISAYEQPETPAAQAPGAAQQAPVKKGS
jgi:hypothetical protein